MKRITTSLAAATIFCAAFTTFTPNALAKEPLRIIGEPVPSIRVSYADLDIQTSAGLNRLNHRISRAATRLCGNGERPLSIYMAQMRCRSETVARAQPQVQDALSRLSATQMASRGDIILSGGI